MLNQKIQSPEIKPKTLVWIITTLYLTTGLTGLILIGLTNLFLGLTIILYLPKIIQSILSFFIFVGGYVLALKIAINFVLERTLIKKKYFKIIIFSVLGLIGLVQIVKGGLNWISLLIISILLLSLYYFGNFWLQRKTREKLAQLQISEDKIPELKIITPQEGVMIFLLIAVISGVFIMQRYLPSRIELEREMAKIDAETRDIRRVSDFITLRSLLYEYRTYYNKFPSSLDELTKTREIIIIYPAPPPIRDPFTDNLYEYQVSSDQQKFVLKAMFETHLEDYLNEDIDGWPLGEGVIDCGIQGPQEREYCVAGGF